MTRPNPRDTRQKLLGHTEYCTTWTILPHGVHPRYAGVDTGMSAARVPASTCPAASLTAAPCRLTFEGHDRQDRFRPTPFLIWSPTMPKVEMAMTAAKVVRTMCPMNCHPTFCGMLVEVESGRLKTVSGDKDNPDSQGFFACAAAAQTTAVPPDSRSPHGYVAPRELG
jgi:Molybdopterin oxidoreductase Fe4S4 domain